MSDDKQEQQGQPPAEDKPEGLLDENGQEAAATDSDKTEAAPSTDKAAEAQEEQIAEEVPTGPLEVSSIVEAVSDDAPAAADAADADSAEEDAKAESEASADAADVESAPNDEATEAESADAQDASDEAGSELPPTSEVRIRSSAARREAAFKAFPVDKDHASARSLVVDTSPSQVDLTPAKSESSGSQNLIVVILIIAVSALGLWQLSIVSSEEVLAAKRAEREAMEEQFLAEQMAKQKRYGILRIESNPPQATVIKNGESIVVSPAGDPAAAEGDAGTPPAGDPNAAPGTPAAAAAAAAPGAEGSDGQPKAGTTPMNLMNVDIGQPYKFKVSKEGYEPFEFAVAEHLWTKDAGEYKFIKMIELIPINCEYWFLYDAKKRREVQFEQKLGCMDHYKQSVARQISVTECACKLPPPSANPEGQAPAPK